MPLDVTGLSENLLNLFEFPPSTAGGCAQAWKDIMVEYASSIIPASVSVEPAGEIMRAQLVPIFENNTDIAALAQLETAFLAFATFVGGGMTGYSIVPPSGLVGFLELILADEDKPPSSYEVPALNFAGKINGWMKTGTATLLVPPNTTTTWT